mmetsp:Transcript_137681/g.343642  ORF Transcript_137681/g.343642 Transcript_137681/m.343642 type:complete len:610 (-) Transcript_137681:217-2046(-)
MAPVRGSSLLLILASAAMHVAGEHAAPDPRQPQTNAKQSDPPAASHRSSTSAKFLRAPPLSEMRADLQQAVAEALGVGHDVHHKHLMSTRARLQPMWRALAKNEQGRIDQRSLRYTLHRYFLHRYGLSLIGLEPLHAKNSQEQAEAALLTVYAPKFVREVLGGKAAGGGFAIEEVAALIAVLERLVREGGHENLEKSYASTGYDMQQWLTRADLRKVMENYMLRWMLGQDDEGVEMLEENRTLLYESFEDWDELVAFAEGRIRAFEYERWSRPMPSTKRVNGPDSMGAWAPLQPLFSFADAQVVVSGITTSFGRYWETECVRVKKSLLSLDRRKNGRVRMTDFHGAALNGEWRFSESTEYLRQQGALDESSTLHGPQVIVPNYLQATSNCIVLQEHFRVCCANECEDHMIELEALLGSPLALPEEVLEAIANITTGDDNPPEIDGTLTSQLNEIANANNGRIPLHGRLFAQWMHFVFPAECAFPHKSGTVSTATPQEYGGNYLASVEELSKNAEANNTNAQLDAEAAQVELQEKAQDLSQWSQEEELLSEHIHLHAPWELRLPVAGLAVATCALAVLCLLGTSSRSAKGSRSLLPTSIGFGSSSHAHYV